MPSRAATLSPDFRDLLSAFNAHGVEYLLVGAYAMADHGRVRATGDLDVWIRPEQGNARRVLAALAEFGAPVHGLTESDLASADLVFQIGLEPVRVDILTSVDGLTFDQAWGGRVETHLGDQPVAVLVIAHQ